MLDFSFRRRERPVFMNSPDVKASSTKSHKKGGSMKLMPLPPAPAMVMPSFNFGPTAGTSREVASVAQIMPKKPLILMAEDNLVNIKASAQTLVDGSSESQSAFLPVATNCVRTAASCCGPAAVLHPVAPRSDSTC